MNLQNYQRAAREEFHTKILNRGWDKVTVGEIDYLIDSTLSSFLEAVEGEVRERFEDYLVKGKKQDAWDLQTALEDYKEIKEEVIDEAFTRIKGKSV